MRRLLVVINRLLGMHGRSALATALLGEEASWSNMEYMIADLIDETRFVNHLTMTINRGENTEPPEWHSYRRPGVRHTRADDVLSSSPTQEFASVDTVAGVLSQLQTGTFL